MSEPQHEEKFDEKRREKDEKSLEEKWRDDPLGTAVWALILIWAGLALLLDSMGVLDDSSINGWQLAFTGAGVILLLEALLRLIVPSYRQPVIGTVILGVVFLAIGLGELINLGVILALAVILIGLSLLLRGFRGRG
jgi:hypothetical protein